MAERIQLPESSGRVARHAPRKVDPCEPHELRGCPKVVEQLHSEPRLGPNFGQTSPMLAKSRPVPPNVERKLARICQILVNIWPILAKMLPFVANMLPRFARCWSPFGRFGPRPAQTRPISANFGRILARTGQTWPDLENLSTLPDLAKFDQ